MRKRTNFVVVFLLLLFSLSCEQKKKRYFVQFKEVTKTEFENHQAKNDSIFRPKPASLQDAILDLKAAIANPDYQFKYDHTAFLDSVIQALREQEK